MSDRVFMHFFFFPPQSIFWKRAFDFLPHWNTPNLLGSETCTLLTCLPVAPDGSVCVGGGWALIAGRTEECDGGIKIIKVSLPAVHASCSWADSESSSENRAAPLMVQTGFSCLLESSCSQVLWLWRDLCRCTGMHTPPFFALFFFLLQGILRIRLLWVIVPACWLQRTVGFSCLHLRFFETVPPLRSWSTSNTTEL